MFDFPDIFPAFTLKSKSLNWLINAVILHLFIIYSQALFLFW